jgi:hypothetical protein
MDYQVFLNKVIDDGIEAARRDYAAPEAARKLKGSIAGFEACRSKPPGEIAALLIKVHSEAMALWGGNDHDAYWEARCKEAEIEWVANVVSAALQANGQPEIVAPTCRGVMKAAEILGVKAA